MQYMITLFYSRQLLHHHYSFHTLWELLRASLCYLTVFTLFCFYPHVSSFVTRQLQSGWKVPTKRCSWFQFGQLDAPSKLEKSSVRASMVLETFQRVSQWLLSCFLDSEVNCFCLLPVLEVDDVGSLQACLQEVAQFLVLGCWARFWAAVLNPCWYRLQTHIGGYIKGKIVKPRHGWFAKI